MSRIAVDLVYHALRKIILGLHVKHHVFRAYTLVTLLNTKHHGAAELFQNHPAQRLRDFELVKNVRMNQIAVRMGISASRKTNPGPHVPLTALRALTRTISRGIKRHGPVVSSRIPHYRKKKISSMRHVRSSSHWENGAIKLQTAA